MQAPIDLIIRHLFPIANPADTVVNFTAVAAPAFAGERYRVWLFSVTITAQGADSANNSYVEAALDVDGGRLYTSSAQPPVYPPGGAVDVVDTALTGYVRGNGAVVPITTAVVVGYTIERA